MTLVTRRSFFAALLGAPVAAFVHSPSTDLTNVANKVTVETLADWNTRWRKQGEQLFAYVDDRSHA